MGAELLQVLQKVAHPYKSAAAQQPVMRAELQQVLRIVAILLAKASAGQRPLMEGELPQVLRIVANPCKSIRSAAASLNSRN